MLHIRRALILFLGLALVVGCGSGPKKNRVSGTVKYKDAPIPAGSITFFAEGSPAPSGGAPIKDGVFEIAEAQGLIEGNYKVAIAFPDPKRTPVVKEGEAPGESREVKEMLPAKYNSASELKAAVKNGGPNEFPFDLK